MRFRDLLVMRREEDEACAKAALPPLLWLGNNWIPLSEDQDDRSCVSERTLQAVK